MRADEVRRLPDPRRDVRITVSEVVRDRKDQTHLFLRVKVTGWLFPHRAQEPFMLIGDAVSTFAEIERDGSSASGYFDRPLPPAEQLSFGYGDTITWDFDLRIDPRAVARLDRRRLPRRTVDPFG
jgi:hypothetical protein